MNYRFLSSISDAEVAEFRKRLAAELTARTASDGARLISDEAIEREVNVNISTETVKGYLSVNDATHYDYAKLADVIAAKYRTFGTEDVVATRKAMMDYYMSMAEKYGWDKEKAFRDAQKEFYDNISDKAILRMLHNCESIVDYVEFVSIYGI